MLPTRNFYKYILVKAFISSEPQCVLLNRRVAAAVATIRLINYWVLKQNYQLSTWYALAENRLCIQTSGSLKRIFGKSPISKVENYSSRDFALYNYWTACEKRFWGYAVAISSIERQSRRKQSRLEVILALSKFGVI